MQLHLFGLVFSSFLSTVYVSISWHPILPWVRQHIWKEKTKERKLCRKRDNYMNCRTSIEIVKSGTIRLASGAQRHLYLDCIAFT